MARNPRNRSKASNPMFVAKILFILVAIGCLAAFGAVYLTVQSNIRSHDHMIVLAEKEMREFEKKINTVESNIHRKTNRKALQNAVDEHGLDLKPVDKQSTINLDRYRNYHPDGATPRRLPSSPPADEPNFGALEFNHSSTPTLPRALAYRHPQP